MKLKWLDKLTQKSSSGDNEFITSGSGCDYLYPSASTDPYSLLRQNKNYVYACANKISQYISSIPIHLYYYTESPKSLILHNHPVHKNLKKQINKEVTNSITQKAKELVEITEDHILLDLILHPSHNMGYPDWIGLIAHYLILMGNCLLEIVRDGEQIVELKILKWENVIPRIQDERIISYQYQPQYGNPRVLIPEQVIHLRQYCPGSTIIGVGNAEKCADSAALYNYYDAYQIALSRNYGMPGVAINVKNKVSNKEEASKMAQEFMNKFSRRNVGRPLVSFGDIDITSLATTPKEMEYKIGREWCLKTIAATMGVPEDLVSTDDSNRASSITAINQFYEITIFPLLTRILETINCNLVKEYYDSNSFYFYDRSEVISDDPATQATIYNSYVSSGVMTINEVRSRLGMEAIEEPIKEPIKELDNTDNTDKTDKTSGE